MEHEPRRRYRIGVDWHRVVFAASLAVAILLIVLSSTSRDGRIRTLFDAEGREVGRQILRDHFPGIAKRLRIGGR